jgi:hypothetical protein
MEPAVRFDRSARHGAALVGIAFAAYLTLATDFSTIVQAANYAGTIPNDVPLVNLVQFLTLLAVYLVSFALVATTPMRRAVALTMVPLALLGWAFLGVERRSGVLPLGDSVVWGILLGQGFITLLVALGGWLIARGLHPLSWIVLIVAPAPALVDAALASADVDRVSATLIVQTVVLVVGLAAAWLAFVLDRAARRRGDAVPPTRFDASTRYGVGLALVIAATYLNIATDFTGYLDQLHYGGSPGSSVLGLLQFLMILALYVVGIGVLPTSGARRLGAVTLVCVVLLLWATLAIERSIGNLPGGLWFYVLDQGFVTLVASLGGWVIARGRHPVALVVVALAIVPPIVARALDDASVTSGSYTLVLEGVIAVGGLVGGGLAWAIDAVAERIASRGAPRPAREARMRAARPPHTRPGRVTLVAVIVWIDGVVQMLTGIVDLAGQGVSGEAARIGALVAALLTVAVGLATVLVGVGLLQGRRVARTVTTVFLALGLAGAVLGVVTAAFAGRPGDVVGQVLQGALDAVAIALLWFGPSGAWFSRGRTPTPAASTAG